MIEEADPGWVDPNDAFRRLIALDTDLDGMRALADEDEEDMSPLLVKFLVNGGQRSSSRMRCYVGRL